MRILQAHCRYLTRGGEDVVVEAEGALLRAAGHEVRLWEAKNEALRGRPLATAASAIWSRDARRSFLEVVRGFRPDVVHLHNTFYAASPSVVAAAVEEGVPVVATLHNYRLLCAQPSLTREDRPCHDCLATAVPWPAVVHRCYRGSAAQSAAVAVAQTLHRVFGAWREVRAFLCLSEHARATFGEAGLPLARLRVKPNFVVGPTVAPTGTARAGALFASRLTTEKGVEVVLDAWRDATDLPPLTVAGDGPLRPLVEARAAASGGRVRYIGPLANDAVLSEVSRASLSVFAAITREGCPLSILEAFAHATPVVAAASAEVAELVHDGVEGLLVERRSSAALAEGVRRLAADEALRARLGAAARAAYEARFTPAASLAMLEALYREVAHR